MSKRLWPAIVVLMLSGFLFCQVPPAASKGHIRNIRWVNTSHLSAPQKSQLIQDLLGKNRTGLGTFHSLSEVVEQAVLAAYADRGYWNAKVKVEVAPTDDLEDGEVSVFVRAIEEGRPYRLHQLRWNGVAAFPESDLAAMVSIHPGQILERAKIAEGMEAVRRLYIAAGYLGYSAIPAIKRNDREGTLDLQMNVDEGGAFTVQSFDVIGLNQALRARLLQSWPFKPGDVYRGENVENFLYANAPLLPKVAADVVCRTVDLTNHTIEFLLDFRPPPLACNSSPEPQMTRQSLNWADPAR